MSGGRFDDPPAASTPMYRWSIVPRCVKRLYAPKGWLKPRGPEGQQGPAPLPLKARDKELINKAALGALMSTSHSREYALN